MSAGPQPQLSLTRAERQRIWLDSLAIGAPIILVAAALGWRALGMGGVLLAALSGAIVLAILAWRRTVLLKPSRLAARLDARTPELEDSAHLLLQDAALLHGLASLQRQRLEKRLAGGLKLDPRPAWSRRAIVASWVMGSASVALLLGLGPLEGRAIQRAARPGIQSAQGPQIALMQLRIIPPAYTGLPQRQQKDADAKIPAGARLEWILHGSALSASPRLVFADGVSMPLRAEQNRWVGGRIIEKSTLYRIEAKGAPQGGWHRLEVIADAPPAVIVIFPTERLSIADLDQTKWVPVFEATDDYGLASRARLRVTIANGEGEQIAVKSREMDIQGSGSNRRRRWAMPLDLAGEGLAPGGDMIVQVIVRDNRRPMAQIVEGPSVILRQPSQASLADGLDGLLVPNVPAFFRSQRQIIIDAEALVKQRRTLAREAFAQRANALASDQAVLRFRYGQFLGEKAEGGAPPPNFEAPAAPSLPTADAPAIQTPAHSAGDGHDHGEGAAEEGAAPNTPQSAARQFGHVHDDGDAATLFDPGTRSLLTRALDAMWSSERELRQARPEAALPFANQALEALKKAQGASRVYLRRTGSRLAALDPTRRLSGKRAGIDPAFPVVPRNAASQKVAFEAWRALEQRAGAPPLRLDALEAWAVANAEARAEPLDLMAAIAALRQDPACSECRQALRAAIWSALQAPATAQRREGAEASSARYLDALE